MAAGDREISKGLHRAASKWGGWKINKREAGEGGAVCVKRGDGVERGNKTEYGVHAGGV